MSLAAQLQEQGKVGPKWTQREECGDATENADWEVAEAEAQPGWG